MSRKRKSRIALIAVPMLLVMLLVGVFVSQFASALTGPPGGEWDAVRGYIDAYFTGQYVAGSEGEAGFIVDQAALKTRIDSNNDGTYLGEGDDAVNAPVLIDSLASATNVIPASSARCNWNSGVGVTNCFDTAQVTTVKGRIDDHDAAGFSTDIVDYCQTGHTEAPVTGGWGFLAQTTNGLGTGITPNVYAFKWGRNGWTNTTKTYTNTGNLGSPVATGGPYANASNPTNCDGVTPDSELVRCIAQWAVTTGAVGNGVNPSGTNPDLQLTGQPIDIRTGSPASTLNNTTSPDPVAVPINTLFNTDLNDIEPAPAAGNNIFIGRTQHVAGMAAMGARMLGYNAGFEQWGMPNWNNTLDEKWVSTGVAYGTIAAVANDLTSGIDITPPSIITGPTASPVGTTTATISRTVSEPATLKVEYGTTQGGPYTTTINNTVLNATKSANLTGLTPGTTYYYVVTSYDGQANVLVSAEDSFVTQDVPGVNDKVYILPWYDSAPANGWIGDWIGVVNMDGVDDADVEIRIGGQTMASQVIPAGQDWSPTPQNFPDLTAGPVEVICWGCVTNATVLVVNERALYGPTFSEILAVEKADLGTQYVFPWYDNVTANNVVGAWVMVTNTDSTEATVTVTINGTLQDTLTIPAGDSDFYIDGTHALIGGPVIVNSTGGDKILVSQRVLYGNSFNEILGQKNA